MIELVPTVHDDAEFLSLAQRIVNGAISVLRIREVYLVHIDNWFDHKWLGWWSSFEHKAPKELYVPPFNPNRVCSQKHFTWDEGSSRWTPTDRGVLLHPRQPGRRASFRRRLDSVSKSAAFVWYSGNTVINSAGNVMMYVSEMEGYAWYASLRKEDRWVFNDESQITRRELVSFEERGLQMELAEA
ncbi:MAG: hypothetical protein IID45_06070 [Planctomycetes bacterium]|nr:hypothetical protein [Planctomycetota bacterium]